MKMYQGTRTSGGARPRPQSRYGLPPEEEPERVVPLHKKPLEERVKDPDVRTFHEELAAHEIRMAAADAIRPRRPQTPVEFRHFYVGRLD